MTNKYYIPEIGELHVGLKIQLMNEDNAQWGYYTIKSTDSFEKFKEDIELEMLTIKYLDREDIESSGFIFNKEVNLQTERGDYRPFTDWWYGFKVIHEYLGKGYRIYYNSKSSYLAIRTALSDGFYLYFGKVKNKSEFVKVLNSLKIK